MYDIVGVRFSRIGHVHFFNSSKHDLNVGDRVIVDGETGQRTGEVAIAPGQFLFSELKGCLNPILGKDGGDETFGGLE